MADECECDAQEFLDYCVYQEDVWLERLRSMNIDISEDDAEKMTFAFIDSWEKASGQRWDDPLKFYSMVREVRHTWRSNVEQYKYVLI